MNSAPPAGGASDGSSGANSGLADPKLINQLIASGVKITPGNVVATGVMPDGRIVWLETGNAIKGGLLHILGEHATGFANAGIVEADIPELVMDAVTEGNIVGYQPPGTERPIFQVSFGGLTYKIAITIGSNGFIVGANPKGRGR